MKNQVQNQAQNASPRTKTRRFSGVFVKFGKVGAFAAVVFGAVSAAVGVGFFVENRFFRQPPPIPVEFSQESRRPTIWPDYADVVLPPNIAPTNFEIVEPGRRFLTRFSSANESFRVAGKIVKIPPDSWRKLLADAAGSGFEIEIFVEDGATENADSNKNENSSENAVSDEKTSKRDGNWRKFQKIAVSVSNDPIDGWISYRLIDPGYEIYRRPTLRQRSLETFDERVFVDAKAIGKTTCVNCHSFQNGRTANFLFHSRSANGGTVLVRGGVARKIDPKLADDALGCAYAAWSPTAPLVAFSTNSTSQMFHSTSPDRIEVFDAASDLVLFDAEKNEISPIFQTDAVLETFPNWAPDGKTLYFCAAKSPYSAQTAAPSPSASSSPSPETLQKRRDEATTRFADFRYDVVRVAFDEKTRTFGAPETVFDADSLGKSAALPRISPEGRYLTFVLSKFGTFPIWRRDADIWALDLQTGEARPLDEINDPDEADSWRCWDSSGRWLVFSSRRDDGTFTRLYFAHFDANGRASKPFLLPQRDPRQNFDRMKSYNLPEFTVEPLSISPKKLAKAARKKPQKIRER